MSSQTLLFPFAIYPGRIRKSPEALPKFNSGNPHEFLDTTLPKMFPGLSTPGVQHNPHAGNSVIAHTKLGMDHLDTSGLPDRIGHLLKLSFALHDVGKLPDALDNDHPRKSPQIASQYLDAQDLEPHERSLVDHLLRWHDAYGHVLRDVGRSGMPRTQAIHRIMGNPPRGSSGNMTYAQIFHHPRVTDLLGRMWEADIEGIPHYGGGQQSNGEYGPNTFANGHYGDPGAEHEADRVDALTTRQQRRLVHQLIEKVWRPTQ